MEGQEEMNKEVGQKNGQKKEGSGTSEFCLLGNFRLGVSMRIGLTGSY